MKDEIYHGCHNSFVIKDDEPMDYEKVAIECCKKYHTDGFIAVRVLPPNSEKTSFEMLYFNQDGSRAPMCGNGIRCMMHYCYLHHGIQKEKIRIKTLGGIMETQITSIDPFLVRVNLKHPTYDPKILSIDDDHEQINQPFVVQNKTFYVTSVFLGTHHCVIFVDDVHQGDDYGEMISNHPFYKAKINVNFAKIMDRKNIQVKTYERGVGWTLACGTGGCSTFAVAHRLGLCDDRVMIHFTDETIVVSIDQNNNIIMEGPSEKIQ